MIKTSAVLLTICRSALRLEMAMPVAKTFKRLTRELEDSGMETPGMSLVDPPLRIVDRTGL